MEIFKDHSSMNPQARREEGRVSAQTGFGLSRLMITCLGIVLVSMLCLLPGCGSDNASKGAAGVKKEKTAKDARAKEMRTITTLLSDKEGTAPPTPNAPNLPGNLSREKMEANIKATEKAMQDPKREVVPGVTMEKLEAKKEAAQKNLDPKREVLPGMTLEQFNAKLIEEQKRGASANLFGLTQEQVRAKTAEAKQSQEGKLNPDQAFPQK